MTNISCAACSMPLENDSLIGAKYDQDYFCIHCIHPDKSVKSTEEVFQGGVHFFQSMMPDLSKDFAEKIVRKNMNKLPYWKRHPAPCLKGTEATDQEFQEVLKRLK